MVSFTYRIADDEKEVAEEPDWSTDIQEPLIGQLFSSSPTAKLTMTRRLPKVVMTMQTAIDTAVAREANPY